MAHQFSAAVERIIQEKMASGPYSSEDDLLLCASSIRWTNANKNCGDSKMALILSIEANQEYRLTMPSKNCEIGIISQVDDELSGTASAACRADLEKRRSCGPLSTAPKRPVVGSSASTRLWKFYRTPGALRPGP